jgi:anti-sigma B factor antagonist
VTAERTIQAGPLTIEVIESGETRVVQLGGELDLGGTRRLENELSALFSTHPEAVIVDLARLEFIDSIGLRSLLKVAEDAKATGNSLQFLAPEGQPATVLEVTGLRDLLPVV